MAEIKGKVRFVGEPEVFPAKNGGEFRKRELVIEALRYDPDTGLEFPDPYNTVPIIFTGAWTDCLEGLTEGPMVSVIYALRGRSYEKDGATKYFLEANGKKVVVTEAAQTTPEPVQTTPSRTPKDVRMPSSNWENLYKGAEAPKTITEDDQLPF